MLGKAVIAFDARRRCRARCRAVPGPQRVEAGVGPSRGAAPGGDRRQLPRGGRVRGREVRDGARPPGRGHAGQGDPHPGCEGNRPGCPGTGARSARQVGAGLRGAMRVLRAAAAASLTAAAMLAPVTAASAAPAQAPCRAPVVSSRCPAPNPTPGSELVDPAAPGLPEVTITFATPVTPTATAGGGGGLWA